MALAAVAGFVGNELQQAATKPVRRNDERLVVVGPAVSGEVIEQLGRVFAHRWVAGEEADVFVDTRRL